MLDMIMIMNRNIANLNGSFDCQQTEHCVICLMMEWEDSEPKANLMTSRTELGFMVCGT